MEGRLCVLKAVMAFMVVIAMLCCCVSSLKVGKIDHRVGGPNGWDLASNIQGWSETSVFIKGDTLVFVYSEEHNVLEVNESDFQSCDNSSAIATYEDGETVVPLTSAGKRYFICGSPGHCTSGLRLKVDVLDLDSVSPMSPPSPEPKKQPYPPNSGVGLHIGGWMWCFLALLPTLEIISDLLLDDFN